MGAPRTTVTLAAGLLRRALIDYSRGVVTIRNLTKHTKTTCGCYDTVGQRVPAPQVARCLILDRLPRVYTDIIA